MATENLNPSTLDYGGKGMHTTITTNRPKIGENLVITANKPNSGYYHSIRLFCGTNGTFFVDEYGDLVASEVKLFNTVMKVPMDRSLYRFFNAANSTLSITVTCYTYASISSQTPIEQTHSILAYVDANPNDCSPSFTVSIQDTNPLTRSLVGGLSGIIRYKSKVRCSVSDIHYPNLPADAPTLSLMTSKGVMINGIDVTRTSSLSTTIELSQVPVTFTVRNSWGFSSTILLSPTEFIQYIEPSFNPRVSRTGDGDNDVYVEFDGKMFVGKFGSASAAVENAMNIRYRCREIGSNAPWPTTWYTVPRENILIVTQNNRFRSFNPDASDPSEETLVHLDYEFDYRKSYEIEFNAYDGPYDANGLHNSSLTDVSVIVQIGSGTPIFNWSKDYFNFNVDVTLRGTNLLDITHPIGTVYISVNSTMPAALSEIGIWEAYTSPGTGLYAWVRTQ